LRPQSLEIAAQVARALERKAVVAAIETPFALA
jgi:hypothetical protein